MSAYYDMIKEQIDALNRATGLPWEHENTGGALCSFVRCGC